MEINYAGWKLAEYEGKGSYQILIADTYNQATGRPTNADDGIHNSPLSFLRGGYYIYDGGLLYGRGSLGYYWEGKPSSATNARYLNFNSTYLDPQNSHNKGYGRSIRCVVR